LESKKIKIDKTKLRETLKDKTVLLVEDEADMAESLKRMLGVYFEKVFMAYNGKEGLKIYMEEDIDIVITDVHMPIMDGLKMAQEIQIYDKNSKILFTSGYNDEDIVAQMKQYTNYILQKPIDTTTLLKMSVNEIGAMPKTRKEA
jgi:YesN/AraC family two-component response regulator